MTKSRKLLLPVFPFFGIATPVWQVSSGFWLFSSDLLSDLFSISNSLSRCAKDEWGLYGWFCEDCTIVIYAMTQKVVCGLHSRWARWFITEPLNIRSSIMRGHISLLHKMLITSNMYIYASYAAMLIWHLMIWGWSFLYQQGNLVHTGSARGNLYGEACT